MKYFFTILFYLIFVVFLISNPISGYEIFIDDGPTALISNYFDYSISTPNGVSVCNQSTEVGGGTYYVFHSRETAASTCRVYYAYQDEDYNVSNVATIGADDLHETAPSLDIDPVTGDPIVAWSRQDGIVVTYDLFHLGSSGLWKAPFHIFDDNINLHHPDDMFYLPIVEIGDSPYLSLRRVYVLAQNQRLSGPGVEYCNAMLAYADFDENDFNMQSELDWSYQSVMLTQNDNTTTSFTFTSGNNGKLAIIGYNFDQQVFAYINDNYGEGEFTAYLQDFKFPVENPLNLDGSPRFVDDQGNPYDLFFAPQFSENTNAIYIEDFSKIMYPVSFSLSAELDIYIVEDCLVYPKIITFDLNSEEFSFYDLHLEGEEPNDDLPMLPWDINEDGNVDSYDMNGKVDWISSWPIYYPEPTLPYPFFMNNMRITQNEENGLISILWNDATKAFLAHNGAIGMSDWMSVPEIEVTYSDDSGITWYPTQCFNSINNPEFTNIIPEFIYPANEITNLGYAEYEMRTMFYDDLTYGSQIGHPQLGGDICCMTLRFEIDEPDYGISIYDPNGSSIWEIGENVSITWAASGSSVPIKIDLINEQFDFVYAISDDPIGNSTEWTIPNSIHPDDGYRIRIMSLAPPNFYIGQLFSIIEPQDADEVIIFENELFQNTPNPFNPTTMISFSLNTEITEDTELVIYNSRGQKVKTFTSFTPSQSHTFSLTWDGTDDSGKPVSSGVYLYKLKAGDFEKSRKMLLLK